MRPRARSAHGWRGRGRGDPAPLGSRTALDRYFIPICSTAFILIIGCATYFVVEILA